MVWPILESRKAKEQNRTVYMNVNLIPEVCHIERHTLIDNLLVKTLGQSVPGRNRSCERDAVVGKRQWSCSGDVLPLCW